MRLRSISKRDGEEFKVQNAIQQKVQLGDSINRKINYLERFTADELKILYKLYKKAESDCVRVIYQQEGVRHINNYIFLLHMVDEDPANLDEGRKGIKFLYEGPESEDEAIRAMKTSGNIMLKYSPELTKLMFDSQHIQSYENLGYIEIVDDFHGDGSKYAFVEFK